MQMAENIGMLEESGKAVEQAPHFMYLGSVTKQAGELPNVAMLDGPL